jgi:hypothetical protein
MIQAHHIKYGTISGLLLLSALMLSTTEDSLYAQITSIPEESGRGSSDTDGSGNNDDSSDSSSGSGSDDDDNGSSGSSDSSDTVDSSDGGSETTDEQTNDMTTSEVETNPLSDAIIKNVTDELTAVGITDLGF